MRLSDDHFRKQSEERCPRFPTERCNGTCSLTTSKGRCSLLWRAGGRHAGGERRGVAITHASASVRAQSCVGEACTRPAYLRSRVRSSLLARKERAGMSVRVGARLHLKKGASMGG